MAGRGKRAAWEEEDDVQAAEQETVVAVFLEGGG